MSGVEIVEAQRGDLDLVVPLFDAYRRFYRQEGDPAGAREFLRGLFESAGSVIFLAVARDEAGGRTALGFTQLFPSHSSVSMKPLWILNDLYVAPEARRRGVARALLERATEHARAAGAKGLVLETEKHNHQAKRLYESLGWVLGETDHYELIFQPVRPARAEGETS